MGNDHAANGSAKLWTPCEFQEVANELLTKHFGIDINDTMLWDEDIVTEVIKAGFQPFQVVQENAEEAGLTRIDGDFWHGAAAHPAITEQDQLAALENVRKSKDMVECTPRQVGPKM